MELRAQINRIGIAMPLLTGAGAVLLFAGALVPLGGSLINLELRQSAALLSLYLLCALVLLIKEMLEGARLLKSLNLEVNLPERALSGISQKIRVSAELPRPAGTQLLGVVRLRGPYRTRIEPDKLRLRFEPGTKLAEGEFEFTPLGRGTVRFAGFDLRLKRTGGTLSLQQHFQFRAAAVRVYPNHNCGSRAADPALLSASIGQRALQEVYSEGREFDSLREYAVGDDLRRVDWKRSSRTRSLLVKVYRPESHQRVMIALDCGRRMGNLVGDRFLLDYAADGAANLLRVVRRHDDEVGFFRISVIR